MYTNLFLSLIFSQIEIHAGDVVCSNYKSAAACQTDDKPDCMSQCIILGYHPGDDFKPCTYFLIIRYVGLWRYDTGECFYFKYDSNDCLQYNLYDTCVYGHGCCWKAYKGCVPASEDYDSSYYCPWSAAYTQDEDTEMTLREGLSTGSVILIVAVCLLLCSMVGTLLCMRYYNRKKIIDGVGVANGDAVCDYVEMKEDGCDMNGIVMESGSEEHEIMVDVPIINT